jgi:hypothetical protein
MDTNEAFSVAKYVHKKGSNENVSPGKQSIGILRAQPGIKGWNIAYVILRQEHII